MAFTCVVCHNGYPGDDRLLVRANLLQASAQIEINCCDGEGWTPTQHQSANARCSYDGLVEIAHLIAAEIACTPPDDFACDIDNADDLRWEDRANLGLLPEGVGEIAHLLDDAGSTFAGDDPVKSAQKWVDAGYRREINDVGEWIDCGVWNPEVAAEFRDAGYTPFQITEVAQGMLDETADPEECARLWYDGCPIYDACQTGSGADLIAYAEQHFADA